MRRIMRRIYRSRLVVTDFHGIVYCVRVYFHCCDSVFKLKVSVKQISIEQEKTLGSFLIIAEASKKTISTV